MSNIEKLKTRRQNDYAKMYVYNANIWNDLLDAVHEYMGESEHNGMKACFPGCLDSDSVDNLENWSKRRKWLLLRDFIEYFQNDTDGCDGSLSTIV